jgi:hypothetical protein
MQEERDRQQEEQEEQQQPRDDSDLGCSWGNRSDGTCQ